MPIGDKRTSVMHDDLGVVSGPDNHLYFTSFNDMVNSIGNDPTCLIIHASLPVTATINVGPSIDLLFMPGGELVVPTGMTVSIGGNVWSHPKQIFRGSVTIENECNKQVHPAWWGGTGGWKIGCITGDVEISGTLKAQAPSYLGDCKILTVCGDTMTGPLILFRDPIFDMEAATRRWVIETVETMLQGEGIGINYYETVVFSDDQGSEPVVLTAQKPADTLYMTFCGQTVAESEITHFLDLDETDPQVDATDLADWFTNLEGLTPGVDPDPAGYPAVDEFSDQGVQIGTCT